jgi:integrase/recombinase XerD
MKPFESTLGPLFEDYILYRAGLGYSAKQLRTILCSFDRYLCDQNAAIGDMTPRFFLELKKRHHKRQSTFNATLRTVRGFFAYLVRRRIVAENPLVDIECYEPNAFIPFVFSSRQTDALLRSVQDGLRKDDRQAFFRDFCAYTAIMLLARCGMRLREPLRLRLPDYRPDDKTLYIAKTKFSKDRLIPIPMAAATELETYLRVRGALIAGGNPYLLPGKNGRALNAKNVYRLFEQSVAKIGIEAKRTIIGNTTFGRPTPHCLRHSFAINTLKAVKERGQCPQNALAILSAYLGHTKYRYTAVYLKVLDAEHRKALVDFFIGRQEEI